jgi:antitoxin component HigA of HigAB toxin-antitoxin module
MTDYQALLLEYTPRPITSEREYRRALKYVEANLEPHPARPKALLLDLLATLIANYEEREGHFEVPDAPAGELLGFLIEQRGITRAELARQTDIPRQKITNAINGTRPLSKGHAIKLAEYFKLQPAAFLK